MVSREGHFEDGRKAVEAAAIYLLRGGFVIDAPELFETGRRAINAPDIRVWRRGYSSPGFRVIEVKSHFEARYTTPEDWPFPEVIVNRCDTWTRKGIKPFATMLRSKMTGSFLVVPTIESEFDTRKLYDRRSERDRDYFVLPNSTLRPVEWLVAALREDDE